MAKSEIFQELSVALKNRKYPLIIAHNVLENAEFLRKYIKSGQVMIVTNDTLAPLYLPFLQEAFADRQCDWIVLSDGEIYKNQQSLSLIYDALIQKQHHRDTTLVALGGGVIGDITGFAASTYQRGVACVQIPTSLLAQVDAAIGGKTAVNHPQAKNMIGSFYQPDAVISDLNTLKTLPAREFQSGIAEVIKYAILTGGKFTEQLEGYLLSEQDSVSELAMIIAECCRLKADYVEKDETEQGQRALLNLGHTFAHALETYTHYQRWLHGEAVAIGLYCAALLSKRMGITDESTVQQVDRLLLLAGLPNRIPAEINTDELQKLMLSDKKIKNGRLHFVLIEAMGKCRIEDQVSVEMVKEVLVSATRSR